MACILSLSSEVARGHVGNAVARFVLQRLGHDVVALPTVVFSNHTGYAHIAGARIEPRMLADIVDALGDNGWLGGIDAVLTGYLPSAEHVTLAVDTVERLRTLRRDLFVLVDPVLGDEPGGLYVAEDAARAIKSSLLPHAHLITPNRFELQYLSGMAVEDALSAAKAARLLGLPGVLATSVPHARTGKLDNVLVLPRATVVASVTRRPSPPHGTGDLIAALMMGHRAAGKRDTEALALAVAGVEAALVASTGHDELRLIASQAEWSAPPPWPLSPLVAGAKDAG